MPVRLSESRLSSTCSRIKITVPLEKGERARKLCSAKRRGKGVPAAFPSYPFRTSSIPSLPISPHPYPSLRILTHPVKPSPSLPKNPFQSVPVRLIRVNSPKTLLQKSLRALLLCGLKSSPTPLQKKTPLRPPRSLREPPSKKITVPLDKGERARKLCSAKRRGKGVLPVVSLPHFFHPILTHLFPSLPILLNRIPVSSSQKQESACSATASATSNPLRVGRQTFAGTPRSR